ncbi:MAG TPA: hypothetical protein VGS57_06580 [Thermoanaerobaculia bacterium]|nr:hypothetical protein [Thermoanaerobaculia bacterium]
MQEALVVPVEALAVRLVTLDGKGSEAFVFLHTSSGRRFGPETLGERLSSGDTRFLPCETVAGVELVNLEQLAYLECAPGLPEVAELDEMSAFRSAALLHLAHGETLSGELRYRRPPFSCRVSDLLNAAEERFLLLTARDHCWYVNRRAIVRIHEDAPLEVLSCR